MNKNFRNASILIFTFTLYFFENVELFGQQRFRIEEAGITIELPSDKWTYGGNETKDSILTHYFDRESLPYKYRNYKQNISASISFSSESIGEMDAVSFSAMKRIATPFEVLEVILPKDLGMSFDNGVGYKGKYADYYGIHTIYIFHLKNNDIGITVMCDISDDLFDKINPEFISTLNSIMAAK